MRRFHSVSGLPEGQTTEETEDGITCSPSGKKPPFLPYEPPVPWPDIEPKSLPVPQDGRIKLAFDLDWQLKYGEHIRRMDCFAKGDSGTSPLETDDQTKLVQAQIQKLEKFGTEIKVFGESCDFFILDMKPEHDCVVYRIGEEQPTDFRFDDKKIRRTDGTSNVPERLVKQELFCAETSLQSHDKVAPWQRIILCQGISMAQGGKAPFLVFDDEDDPVRMATKLHLSCERRGGSGATNPYIDNRNAFHITFYEMLGKLDRPEKFKNRKKEWKIGELYPKPREDGRNNDDLLFRQSALTMLATASGTEFKSQLTANDRYWTTLLLSPSGFFERLGEKQQDWRMVASQKSKQTAELACVLYALREVETRWRDLNKYIAGLLTKDFMHPKDYIKGLFDDENLTQSKLYFWIIGCLNEFVASIEDNIKQWKLFRAARVLPPRDPAHTRSEEGSQSAPTPDWRGTELQDLDEKAEKVHQSLQDLQLQFESQLKKVEALRNGLFNASALIESRSSTRLGQNVELLTYVSIFYLPLAFCAALWAVPNITDGGTRNPFIITAVIVGFTTYIFIFNIRNFAQALGRKYGDRRKHLLEKMKADPRPRPRWTKKGLTWAETGEDFEGFPPAKEGKTTPSELWMIAYQIRTLFRRRSTGGGPTDNPSAAEC